MSRILPDFIGLGMVGESDREVFVTFGTPLWALVAAGGAAAGGAAGIVTVRLARQGIESETYSRLRGQL